MREKARRWKELSQEMQALSADSKATRSDFGLVKSVEPPHDTMAGAATAWSSGAGTEFDDLGTKLGGAAGGYSFTEESNAATARRVSDGGH